MVVKLKSWVIGEVVVTQKVHQPPSGSKVVRDSSFMTNSAFRAMQSFLQIGNMAGADSSTRRRLNPTRWTHRRTHEQTGGKSNGDASDLELPQCGSGSFRVEVFLARDARSHWQTMPHAAWSSHWQTMPHAAWSSAGIDSLGLDMVAKVLW
ncbi:hypothetical protein RRG08_018401 [Elysia crispata]|uniref:Uncharacterized protein n=1 Tax=Elysia crispata TaxID=231223 RepID=A0AAE0ZEC0_9GAST|nr:hypothetical protein RRG08_018401 [Elysia crispata]